MSTFNNFGVEITDNDESSPSSFVGNVAVAGAPVTLTHPTASVIQLAYIQCNGVRDINSNIITKVLKYSIDNGATYLTLLSGESLFLPGNFASLKLDTNSNVTYYQVILWG